jgi:DNA uptake protein ComE-like DNA-binding protein
MTTPVSRPPGGAIPSAPVPGRPSDQPRSGGIPGRIRQLAWASVPIWSLSLLAFAPFLRIALARRRGRDWAVFAGYLAAVVLIVIMMSLSSSDQDAVGAVAGTMALVVGVVAAVHAFIAFRPGPETVGGSAASELALTTARTRMRRREQARELAASNPVLAHELGVGRPDVPHDYDDGGLVDVNHVPGQVLQESLGLTAAESAAIISVREQLGRFSGPDELTAYTELTPDRIDTLRDWMLFA